MPGSRFFSPSSSVTKAVGEHAEALCRELKQGCPNSPVCLEASVNFNGFLKYLVKTEFEGKALSEAQRKTALTNYFNYVLSNLSVLERQGGQKKEYYYSVRCAFCEIKKEIKARKVEQLQERYQQIFESIGVNGVGAIAAAKNYLKELCKSSFTKGRNARQTFINMLRLLRYYSGLSSETYRQQITYFNKAVLEGLILELPNYEADSVVGKRLRSVQTHAAKIIGLMNEGSAQTVDDESKTTCSVSATAGVGSSSDSGAR